MQLLASLISGVRGAENGTVELYQRGTTTPITWYSSFEGTVGGTGSTTLDANGGAQVYVNQSARVIVKSQLGVTIRDYVEGQAATDVEVRSQSFTGNDYGSGASAVGNPVMLSVVLDRLYSSFGAVDFKGLLNGTPTNMSTILAAISGLRYFVVTDPTYGALGDGVANDLSGLQAAINAAHTAGGGVVFLPNGTYLVNGTLTTYQDVAIQGYSADLTVIKAQSSSVSLISGEAPASIRNVKFDFSATSYTGNLLSLTGSGKIEISDVNLDDPNSGVLRGAFLYHSGAGLVYVKIVDSDIDIGANGLISNGNLYSVSVSRCNVIVNDSGTASAASLIKADLVALSDVSVTMTGTSGTRTVVEAYSVKSSGLHVEVYGAITVIVFFTAEINGELYETGTTIREQVGVSTIVLYSGFQASSMTTAGGRGVVLGSRVHRTEYVSANADPLTIPADVAKYVMARVTSGAGWTGNCNVGITQAVPGDEVIVSFWNDTGGSLTFEWGASVSIAGGTTFAVAANSFRTFHLVCGSDYPTSDVREWFLVGSTGGAEVVE